MNGGLYFLLWLLCVLACFVRVFAFSVGVHLHLCMAAVRGLRPEGGAKVG